MSYVLDSLEEFTRLVRDNFTLSQMLAVFPEHAHIFGKDSLEDALQELVVRRKEKIKIETAATNYIQARYQSTSDFFKMPECLQWEVAGLTGNLEVHSWKDAKTIVTDAIVRSS